jgi:hypothetical protein
MIELIVKRIMANIAQYTQLFDTETNSTTCVTEKNTVTITGLNGEYVLSGGIDGVASKSCLNDIHDFVSGVVTLECFFGDAQSTVNCVTHKVNVGSALTRDFALETIIDEKIDNLIITYWEATQNTKTSFKYTASEDGHTMWQQQFGVMFKVKATEMQAIGGCQALDKIIAHSVIEVGDDDATLIRFDSIKDRFYAGEYYCVDMGFSYLEDMNINDIIRNRVKNFDTVLDTIEIND